MLVKLPKKVFLGKTSFIGLWLAPFVFGVWVLHMSVTQFMSVIFLEQARESMSSDNGQERVVSVLNGLSLVERSLAWSDLNADAHSYYGFLLLEKWQLESSTSREQDSLLLAEAIKSLDRAIEQKPGWPFYHIQKAQIFSAQNRLDEGFYRSFQTAYELGRYEKTTALNLLKIGLHHWSGLSEEMRAMVIELMHLSLQQKSNSPRDLWQLVDGSNLGTWFCFKLPVSERRDRFCSYK